MVPTATVQIGSILGTPVYPASGFVLFGKLILLVDNVYLAEIKEMNKMTLSNVQDSIKRKFN